MFRHIYWVAERVYPNGCSSVTGVYTSIPNLIRQGLQPQGSFTRSKLRLTLVRLDANAEPFGTYCEPHFDGLADDLDEFVRTDEFSREQCQALVEALFSRAQAA